MDVSPVEHIAFRVNRMFAFSFAQAIFDSVKISFIRRINLLRAPAFYIFYRIHPE